MSSQPPQREPNPRVRTYEDRDEAALIGLVRELQVAEAAIYDRMKPPEEIARWYVEAIETSTRDAKGCILVAELDGAIVGYATVLIELSSSSEIDEIAFNYAEIGDLAVTEKLRGRGIGKLLLIECERRAREAGARWLRITALARNEAAVAAYRRAGFEPLFVQFEKTLGE